MLLFPVYLIHNSSRMRIAKWLAVLHHVRIVQLVLLIWLVHHVQLDQLVQLVRLVQLARLVQLVWLVSVGGRSPQRTIEANGQSFGLGQTVEVDEQSLLGSANP